MRLKFRAWDRVNCKMLNWEQLGSTQFCALGSDDVYDYEQFTGLTDKNKVEIYEGDVLMLGDADNKGIVAYHLPFAGWSVFVVKGHITRLSSTAAGQREVIGNIHQNPELIDVSRQS